jgi:hypothetical protein
VGSSEKIYVSLEVVITYATLALEPLAVGKVLPSHKMGAIAIL